MWRKGQRAGTGEGRQGTGKAQQVGVWATLKGSRLFGG